tara:strand:+ start:429 stop:908 length:480 start_codon:yes stop_codon:yes gene_type:complete
MSYFNPISITKRCQLPIHFLGNNIKETLTSYLKNNIEGKCINEGFIEKNSIEILDISTGILKENIFEYSVLFECKSCYPVEGMIIECTIQNITKVGVKAHISHPDNPLVIFVSRDLHLDNDAFATLEIGDIIRVKVIGVRFEINDHFVSVISEFVEKTN